MTLSEQIAYLAGVRETLDLAERIGTTIMMGPMAPLRREMAAGSLLAFVDEVRAAMLQPEPETPPTASATASGPQPDGSFVLAGGPKVDRAAARSLGYTGDACTMCASFSVKRNGSCLVCESCGATTGCS